MNTSSRIIIPTHHHQQRHLFLDDPIQQSLDVVVTGQILSFLDENDLYALMKYCSRSDLNNKNDNPGSSFWKESLVHSIRTRSSLHLSVLRATIPNTILGPRKDARQQEAVLMLLEPLQRRRYAHPLEEVDSRGQYHHGISNETTTTMVPALCHLECTNLRNLSGEGWLAAMPAPDGTFHGTNLTTTDQDDHIQATSTTSTSTTLELPPFLTLSQLSLLHTLDLSGCATLDPDCLQVFLSSYDNTSTTTTTSPLQHLYLHGCIRVGVPVLQTIGQYHSQLRSLSIGGCSQSIQTRHIQDLLTSLTQLEYLNLEALQHLVDNDDHGSLLRNNDSTSTAAGTSILLHLPASLKSIDLSSCRKLRLSGLPPGIRSRIQGWRNDPTQPSNADTLLLADQYIAAVGHPLPATQTLILNNLGTPRRGLVPCTLAFLALGKALRHVELDGAEQVEDWEVHVLAKSCGSTLTSLKMRACNIGNASLESLATYCSVLGELDVSACLRIGDLGLLSLCRSTKCAATLRALKVANLPKLTNHGLGEMSRLISLHVLDIHHSKVSLEVLVQNLFPSLSQLIDVDARGLVGTISTQDLANVAPHSLRFWNQRVFVRKPSHQSPPASVCLPALPHSGCCMVRFSAQRLNKKTAAAPNNHHLLPTMVMQHCRNCELLPRNNRGICGPCASTCHRGHDTFVGSYLTPFYCDCPFGIAPANGPCQVLFLPQSRA